MKHVLIVEDDRDIQENLGLFLESEGYAADAAFDGRQALDYLNRGERPSVILLDLMMPGMSGYELLDELYATNPRAYPDIPIILLSAAADADRVARQRGLLCVRKPFTLDCLAEALTKAVP